MFFDPKGSKEDQRLRNLIFYKVYATDEELTAMAPYLGILALIALLAAIAYAIFS